MVDTVSNLVMTTTPPRLTTGQDGAADKITLSGDWTVETMQDADRMVSEVLRKQISVAHLDLADLTSLDTSGAWAIVRLIRELGLELSAVHPIHPDHRILFDAVWDTNRVKPTPAPKPNAFWQACDKTGRDIVEVVSDIRILAYLMGGVLATLVQGLASPRKLRVTAIINHMEQTGLKAVPIVAIMSFLVGAIVAQQGAFQLRKFGAEPFVIDLVGILVLREVGILLTAILVAGRSGSAFTAEIGSMRMREEIDAMRVMGLNVIEVLITPRVIALILVLPLLGIVADFSALIGGGMLLWVYSDITPASYINWLRESVAVNTFMVGMIKAPFMASYHRPDFLRRGLAGRRQRRVSGAAHHCSGCEIHLPDGAARRRLRRLLCRRRILGED